MNVYQRVSLDSLCDENLKNVINNTLRLMILQFQKIP